MRKRWTKEAVARVVEMRASGMTLAAIGKEHGVVRERIRQILFRHEREQAHRDRIAAGWVVEKGVWVKRFDP